MFQKDSKPSYTEALGKTNRIVEGTIIRGEIDSTTDFRLDGHLIGNFNSKGKLVLGPSGKVTGDIFSKNVDIEGIVEGKIIAEDLLNIKSTAVIKGEVTCGKLAVEPGADFTATCTMKSVSKTIDLNKTDDNQLKEKAQ
jgi:cytoskeletal protein CcmA (bactofilin family)